MMPKPNLTDREERGPILAKAGQVLPIRKISPALCMMAHMVLIYLALQIGSPLIAICSTILFVNLRYFV